MACGSSSVRTISRKAAAGYDRDQHVLAHSSRSARAIATSETLGALGLERQRSDAVGRTLTQNGTSGDAEPARDGADRLLHTHARCAPFAPPRRARRKPDAVSESSDVADTSRSNRQTHAVLSALAGTTRVPAAPKPTRVTRTD
jgi:hypothetical protein